MQLRRYQADCVEAVAAEHRRVRATLVSMATGLGKTTVFAEIAGRQPKGLKTLTIVHREELAQQAVARLHDWTGDWAEIDMGKTRASPMARHVVTSVQTASRPRRLQNHNPGTYAMVIVDEAHHAVAETYQRVIAHFAANPDCRVLGVTATPKRADDLALGRVFESVAYEYDLPAAIGDGWLVPVTQRIVQVDGLDFSKIRTTAGDWNQGDLEKVVATEQVLHEMVAPTVDIVGDRQALVFAVSVKHAELVAALLDRYRPGKAAWVCGETEKNQRAATVAAYKSGTLQYLVNVGVFTEGFDAPETAAVVVMRSTQSPALYAQMLGRVTRATPGLLDPLPEDAAARRAAIAASRKPNGLVVDYAGNAERHGRQSVTAVDLLGGDYDTEIRSAARRNVIKDGRWQSVEEALAYARAEHALLTQQKTMDEDTARILAERNRRREIVAKASYRTRDLGIDGPSDRGRSARAPGGGGRQATNAQVWYLVNRCGWDSDSAVRLTVKQAGAIIGRHKGEAA